MSFSMVLLLVLFLDEGVNGGAAVGNPDMLALGLPGAGDLLPLRDLRRDFPPGDTISEGFDRPGDCLLLSRSLD